MNSIGKGFLGACAVLLVLTGCGGGGGDDSATPAVPQSLLAHPDEVATDEFDVVVASKAAASNGLAQTAAASFQNPVQRENARGARDGVTGAWAIPAAALASDGEIEGYASTTSVARGERIKFYINVKDTTRDPWYGVTIYRMGWYGGKGGRQVTSTIYRYSRTQPACPMVDTANRMIECNWNTSIDLGIPRYFDDSFATSGIYLAKLTTSSGKSQYIPFVVRDDSRRASALFQASVTTYLAYNNWGGYSLYMAPAGESPAHKVSFDRPYANRSTVHGAGAGDFLFWEIHALRFIEREGYDVVYATDIDTHSRPLQLRNYRAFLSVGHDEYWSREMYDAVEGARNAGVNLAFLGANNAYWSVRFEPATSDRQPLRTMVAYKYWPERDPLGATSQSTVMWRQSPLNRPESSLIGVQYDYDPVDGDIVIDNCPNWICAGTNLKPGDRLTGLLGYEVDSMTSSSPSNIVSLARSPYTVGTETRYSNMTFYTHPGSGAGVFATGSMYWNWGLDAFAPYPERANPAAQQITRNVLNRFVGR